jgi:thioesterase domain-containing protein
VHPAGGNVLCYYDLAHHLGKEQPFYGLKPHGIDGEQEPCASIEEMASHYVYAVRSLQPEGPYSLGGWSLGAVIAFEMAQQLRAQNQQVSSIVFIDPPEDKFWKMEIQKQFRQESLIEIYAAQMATATVADLTSFNIEDFRLLAREEQLACLIQQGEKLGIFPRGVNPSQIRRDLEVLDAVYQAHVKAFMQYSPKKYEGRITLFRGSESPRRSYGGVNSSVWDEFAGDGIDVQVVSGDHFSILKKPDVQMLAERLMNVLNAACEKEIVKN